LVVFETIRQINSWVESLRLEGKTVGLVPTMGALHPGHVSLVRECRSLCDAVIVSIFVNPTQFNNSEDLKHYPRTLSADISMLEAGQCDAVFAPSVQEIYPTLTKGHWDFGALTSSLEGFYRPGHFDGVITVVKRLFEITLPDMAFFGEKDFQQLAVIKAFVKQSRLPLKIVSCKTLREPDGLAMSSRNTRLKGEERTVAVHISKILLNIKSESKIKSPKVLIREGTAQFQNYTGIKLEYLAIVDGDTFEPLTKGMTGRPVALVAAYVGDVRLIDNMPL
jgi:pantoate--beta-alanine ligase